MKAQIDTVYEIPTEDETYILRPNPDGEPGTGFAGGAQLSWREGDLKSDPIFISPAALEAVGTAFLQAAKDITE